VRTLDQNIGRLGFGAIAASSIENSPNIRVRVQRVAGLAGNVSVQYAVSAGSATEGTDYVATSGTLRWGAGDAADRFIVVSLLNDTTVEGPETLTATLSSPTNGATIDGSNLLTITISDDDADPPPSSGGGGGAIDLALLALLASTLLAARADVQIALRIRHAHAVLLESLPDLDQHVTLDVLHAVLRVTDPET
jgi:Calx-beta domain